MAQRSKWFRVALEGGTTDGREISRQDIIDCADTFNPDTYGVRVNLEHIRGIIPGGSFDALGDVREVKYQEDEVTIGGKTAKRLGLYAKLEPLPALVDLNKKKQKIYTSCEIVHKMGDSNRAGLMGLAVTDTPASFGSEALQFSAKSGLYDGRKHDKANLLTEAVEVDLEFQEFDEGGSDDQASAFASVKNFFNGLTAAAAAQGVTVKTQPPQSAEPEGTAPEPDQNGFQMFATQVTNLATAMEKTASTLALAQKETDEKVKKLTEQLETADLSQSTRRQTATGKSGSSDFVY